MWWFDPKPGSPAELRRENKRLRQLVAKQEEEILQLRSSSDAERAVFERELLAKERDLEEAHSVNHIQQVELRQQAAVIERDRQRVQAEMSGYIARAAVETHQRQMRGGNGQALSTDKNSPGG